MKHKENLIVVKFQSLKTFCFVSPILATLLTSCSGVTPIPEFNRAMPPTVFFHETGIPNVASSSEVEVIEPENVGKLQMIDKWGKGNVYGVALSPEETRIAVSIATGIYIYDYETLQEKQFIDLPITLSTKGGHSPSKSISFGCVSNELKVWYH